MLLELLEFDDVLLLLELLEFDDVLLLLVFELDCEAWLDETVEVASSTALVVAAVEAAWALAASFCCAS